jgi:predicted CDP-diglyceride synthetase/phosphatidate cytidylyltransferase
MKKIVLLVLCLIFSLSSFAQKEKLTLVKDGKSDYVIIIPNHHSYWILYSAYLLQHDIYKVTNCLIPIYDDLSKKRKKEICISYSRRFDPKKMKAGYGYSIYTDKEKINSYILNRTNF